MYLRITSICGCLSVTLFLCAGARTMGPMKDQRCEQNNSPSGDRPNPSLRFCRHLPCQQLRRECSVCTRNSWIRGLMEAAPLIYTSSLSFLPFIMAFAPGAIILSGADMTAPPQTNHRRKEGKSEGAKTKRLVLSFFPSFHSAHTRCFLFEIPRHIESRLIFVAVSRREPTLK